MSKGMESRIIEIVRSLVKNTEMFFRVKKAVTTSRNKRLFFKTYKDDRLFIWLFTGYPCDVRFFVLYDLY